MVDVIRKFVPSPSVQTAPGGADPFASDETRRVMLQCSSEAVDIDGDIVVQSGIDLGRFRRNPVILWQHAHSNPIARAVQVSHGAQGLEALVEFPAPGVSTTADWIYGMVRADVIRGVSIGFRPVASVPIDKGNPAKGPQRYTRVELLEISVVSVPANPDGRVSWKFAEGGEEARLKEVKETARRMRQIDVLRLKVPR